jgi:hypothetical protein
MNKVAIGIACWNRPHYFKELVKSLDENLIDLFDVDTHLFIDGEICKFTGVSKTDKSLIDECIRIFDESFIPNKTKHVRNNNVSVAINQFEMMQDLFSSYEKVIFLEDDIVLSKNFVYLMKRVLDQFRLEDYIFSVSPGFKLLCDNSKLAENISRLKISEGHFWAEAMWAHKWQKIIPKMNSYMDIVSQKPYNERNGQKIKHLFEMGGRSMSATSQDNAKDWAISTSGMKRARMIINRATGIGDIGVHSTREKLAHFGDGHNKIYVLDGERSIERFEVVI